MNNGRLVSEEAQLLREIVANESSLRRELIDRLLDPRRDVYKECGLPPAGRPINPFTLQDLYAREAVAARVVELFPKESWGLQPTVYESEDPEEITPFEQSWDELGSQLRGEHSYYKEEEGSPVWEYLLRADILSGIGAYGIILLGLEDGRRLSEPVAGTEEFGSHETEYERDEKGKILLNEAKQARTKSRGSASDYSFTVNKADPPKLRYIRCFPETQAQIARWETNRLSPRCGMPTAYLITFNDPRDSYAGIGAPLMSEEVHWTRVIHIVDTWHHADASEVAVTPRLSPVINHVEALMKVYGGDGEAYWQSAFPKTVMTTHPTLGGQVKWDENKLKNMMENMRNGSQRDAILKGLDIKILPPALVDPTPHVAVHIEAICIKKGCPVPVFKGYEIGEQASSENRLQWDDRLRNRRFMLNTPRQIVPFVDRLITFGVLAAPKTTKKPGITRNARLVYNRETGQTYEKRVSTTITTKTGYCVEWPEFDRSTAKERAEVAATTTSTLATYVQAGLNTLVPPHHQLTKVIGWDEEEVEQILEDAEKEEKEPENPEEDGT